MSYFNHQSRRAFLSMCIKGGASVAALTSLQLQALGSTISTTELTDHKALVCIFLHGGSDSLNMLVPLTGEQRLHYEQSRQNLAIADPLPLNTLTQFDGGVGLHPSMSAISSIFNAGQLGFVGGVGTLITPTTLADYQNKAVPLPNHLFSHNDQQATWMNGREKISLNTGWGARMLERLNQHSSFTSNISLAGANPWQAGIETTPYALNKSGVMKINSLTGYQPQVDHVKSIMDRLLSIQTNSLQDAYASRLSSSISNVQHMNTLLEQAPILTTQFSDNSLSEQLAAVAKSLSISDQTGNKRQIFFVSLGGFDTHDEQVVRQPALLSILATALAEFNSALTELSLQDSVTTFTMSDFGRTLTSNGDGTDHGWASNQLIMGGAVNGQDLHGAMLSQQVGSNIDVGGGRLIPQFSNEQYFSPIAKWFGLNDSEINDIFPNLGNFDAFAMNLFR
ncbi:DUF1501 domain-containing protein [Pseudoalteromonas luteoviolacea]|uniref:Tat pathway signal protein n=1 Tax=Pseudoalteromonas luteoviolacea S4054 TaxID=1129367 RepID=A0A0F6AGR1_9GAMM|nr:DUF1501 domain-containing protein [Pseudoalteromonas luteoviolacea]AOT11232.1 hypothetical protein S4054249_25755 [Pseudoalteromonas luteoviolacea]AOT15603.1 hypothetical protein S40542_22755 [Pseudoalteromonas luteoviolacea]AOT21053.1 hypothetical protein S4054_25675 [Pseudoalteromonas luteoviolacea]KKE84589.1 hypothetical protein N479_08470 [Pseudoalteromonas luteoviolacea S4054]KZN71266.1 hypothetical protein N481_18950 [Pseudoalteromonas luteoviolacea S4047-1]